MRVACVLIVLLVLSSVRALTSSARSFVFVVQITGQSIDNRILPDKSGLDETSARVEIVFQQRLTSISGVKHGYMALPMKRRYADGELILKIRVDESILVHNRRRVKDSSLITRAWHEVEQTFPCQVHFKYTVIPTKELDKKLWHYRKFGFPPSRISNEAVKRLITKSNTAQPALQTSSKSVKSTTVKLTVKPTKSQQKTKRHRSLIVKHVGESVVLNCINLIFRQDLTETRNMPLPRNSANFRSNDLVIEHLDARDSGVYTCWSTEHLNLTTLLVLEYNRPSKYQNEDKNRDMTIQDTDLKDGVAMVRIGSPFTFQCHVNQAKSGMAVKWTRYNGKHVVGLDGPAIRIIAFKHSDSGFYICQTDKGQLIRIVLLRVKKYYNDI